MHGYEWLKSINETILILSTHVSPPRPMDVKKLIANLVFLGSSRGNRPSNATCIVL
jgi:hypothetical protein